MSKHDNAGGLWNNKYKTDPKHPDYVGEITIDGITHKIAGWSDMSGNPRRPIVNLVVSTVEFKTPDKDLPF